MAKSDNEPDVNPEPVDETTPQQDPAKVPTPTEPVPPAPIMPAPQKQRTIGGVHDLSDHPAVVSGQVLNTGDTALSRDPNSSNFNRPILSAGEQKTGERSTTTSDPAKKTVRGKAKSDGAGPES